MKKILKLSSLPFLFIIFLSSCNNDKITEWDTDVILPLAEGSLGLQNLIPDSIITSDSGEPLFIRIEFDYNLIPEDSLIRIPDTLLSEEISLPLNFSLPSGFNVANLNQLIRFRYKDIQLHEVVLQEGFAEFSIRNSLSDIIFVDFSIPKVTFEGSPVSIEGQEIQAGSTNDPFEFVKLIDLKNHSLDLRGDNSINTNQLRLTLEATLNPLGTGADILANVPFLKYQNRFFNLVPSFARGFLGESSFSFDESTDINFLKKLEGIILLEEVTLNLELENSVGADFGIRIMEVSAKEGNTDVSLEHPLIGAYETVSRAQNIPFLDYPFTPTVNSYQFNSSNSNIKEFIESLPERIEFKVQADLNPLGNITSGNDFIYKNSNIKLKSNLQFPLKFSANNVVFRDTITFDGLRLEDTELIGDGELTLVAENGFPFDMSVQLEFLDTNYNTLSTVLIDQTITAANVDSDLKVIEPKISRLTIPVSDELKNHLDQARYIGLRSTINSKPNDTLLPMYRDYSLNLKVIGDGKYRVQIN